MIKIRYVRIISNANLNNCYYLEDRNWDDFGFKTTFNLYYRNNNSNKLIGQVKILNKKSNITKNNLSINDIILDKNFISLGQNREYYEKINELNDNEKNNILNLLRDYSICSKDEISEFKKLEGFNSSLLREWEANLILENINKIKYKENLNSTYTYKTRLENALDDHIIKFSFDINENLSFRNFIIVGKNGVGKTSILKNLIKDIKLNNKSNFSNGIPNYDKVLLFYYGEDLEYDIEENEIFKKINLKDTTNTSEEDDIKEIEKEGKKEYLLKALNELLDININDLYIDIKGLSSGQLTMYKLLIKFLLYVKEKQTLIIIDEPETHLHPNIIGRFMIYFRRILEDFKIHSIMSTHSPIILQQTFSKNIRIIEREDNIPIVKMLDFECFGENLSQITQEVFNLLDFESDYKQLIKELKRKNISKDKLLSIVGKNISTNIKTYITSIYNNSGDEGWYD